MGEERGGPQPIPLLRWAGPGCPRRVATGPKSDEFCVPMVALLSGVRAFLIAASLLGAFLAVPITAVAAAVGNELRSQRDHGTRRDRRNSSPQVREELRYCEQSSYPTGC